MSTLLGKINHIIIIDNSEIINRLKFIYGFLRMNKFRVCCPFHYQLHNYCNLNIFTFMNLDFRHHNDLWEFFIDVTKPDHFEVAFNEHYIKKIQEKNEFINDDLDSTILYHLNKYFLFPIWRL